MTFRVGYDADIDCVVTSVSYVFWETVRFNQGFQNVRLFRGFDEARHWVLQT